MAFPQTIAAQLAAQKQNLEPQLILEIDGVPTRYGVRIISKKVRIGDPGLVIGGGWRIGGTSRLENQADIIQLDNGTSTSIRQQLDPSKGIGSSISSMQIALQDRDGQVTELVTPGFVVEDMLGRRARVYLGLQDTSFPEDFITVFRGIVDDIQVRAGSVLLNIAHPDQKKRQTLFTKQNVKIYSVLSQALVSLESGDENKLYYNRPLLAAPGLQTYFKHGDEVIKYRRSEGLFFLDRAQLGTIQGTDLAVGTELESFYTLEGGVMDLALRLMLSDAAVTPYLVGLPITSFKYVDIYSSYDQGLYFRGVDLVERYGVSIGDSIKTSVDSTNYFGNGTVKITDIIKRYDGTVLIVDHGDANYNVVENKAPTQTISFTSIWNNLGIGLGMKPDEVDVNEHLRLRRLFLSSFNVFFYIKDEENIKEFIEKELYLPAGAYSLPRKSKASVGLHVGPIPGAQSAIITFNDIVKPSQLSVRRSVGTNFANTIIYQYEEDLSSNKLLRAVVNTDEDSIHRIKVGTKALVIKSRGLRASLNGSNLATAAAQRRLNRYKFAAEYIENLQVFFKKGYAMEVGDIFLLVADGLHLMNSKLGNRSPEPKLYEIINKSLDIKTGAVTLSIVDTSFSTSVRYGLISPSSRIRTGVSQTKFIIEQAYESPFGAAEYLKWSRFVEGSATVGVKIRSADFTTRFFQTTIKAIVGNEIEVTDDLGFTPQAGDILEFADYDFAGTTAVQKSLYGYMKDGATFADGGKIYAML